MDSLKNKGFSLVEAAIVLAVLLIFSAIAIPAFNCVRRRAISTAAQETIRQIKEECEANYMYGIDKFTSSNPDKYQIAASGSNSCSGGTVTLTPEDTNLYPTYLYEFADSELSYNFKGQTGTSFVVCNKLICGDGRSNQINLDQDFVVKDSYLEKDCSAYVLVDGPSWDASNTNAKKLGGHLVTLNNKEESEWILKNIQWIPPLDKSRAYKSDKIIVYWIGLNDAESEGKLNWADGTEVDYTQRPASDAYGDEDWFVLSSNGEWNDLTQTPNDWSMGHWQTKYGIAEIPICN